MRWWDWDSDRLRIMWLILLWERSAEMHKLGFHWESAEKLSPPLPGRNVVKMGYPYQNLSPYMEPRIWLGLAHRVRKSTWKLQISTPKRVGKCRFHISWTFRSFFKGKTVLGVLLRTFYDLCRVFSSKPSLSYSPMAIFVILQDLGVSYGYYLVLEPWIHKFQLCDKTAHYF